MSVNVTSSPRNHVRPSLVVMCRENRDLEGKLLVIAGLLLRNVQQDMHNTIPQQARHFLTCQGPDQSVNPPFGCDGYRRPWLC